MSHERKAYQPIHPTVREKLDPEYVALHDSIIQFIEPSEAQPWNPSSRLKPNPLAHAMQKISQVGKSWDEELGGGIQVRVFLPEGQAPPGRWPCLVWLHGGGWVNGGLGSENGLLTHVCKHVGCVVITINYRHAPEHVYPAALDDCMTGLRWVVEPANASRLSINTSLLTIGGLSAGGNLAAVLTMKASLENVAPVPVSQILICPVIDSTATVETVWSPSQHAPWLTPGRMTWYQDLYFPHHEDKKSWHASPCSAPQEILARSPKTWIAIAEIDLLAPEGLAYAEQLKDAGVEVEARVYEGATHSVLILAGIHQVSRQLVHDACSILAEGFGLTYDGSLAPIYAQE